ncbi:HD domain-containing protein [Antarcticibacterium flavum]|uniref:HD domain-containing protein n=1 Tax=Antarcticibacterium flavum TaxID=2058175 RepID=A0A5B7WZL8_9FLAO|nr:MULTISPECIES: HD domain-containing protein [Antarcticibacterium]MCM4158655.1 HD family phosphohydrolase [Antarcticibacterium sp. W02-3]QCY68509.1 HD domain-containing protein [Antarcticibacterium flavum]
MQAFKEIYDIVINALATGVPAQFTYHDAAHTKYVLEQAEVIAKHENVTGRELLLVKIAALYHDIGFLKGREDHESLGCKIAGDDLQDSLLTKDEILKVCAMIKATQIPQQPKTHLEKIVADADLEYLGTKNFKRFGDKLYKELLYFDPELNPRKWDEIQMDFLTSHTYHTSYCKKFKEPVKQQNLEMVKERLLAYK